MSGQAQALRLTQGSAGQQRYDRRRLGRSLWWRPGSEEQRSQVDCRGGWMVYRDGSGSSAWYSSSE